MVIPRLSGGTCPKYFAMESSRVRRPRSWSCKIETMVKSLVLEPICTTEFPVIAACVPRLARPYPFLRTTWPSLATRATPEKPDDTSRVRTESARAPKGPFHNEFGGIGSALCTKGARCAERHQENECKSTSCPDAHV